MKNKVVLLIMLSSILVVLGWVCWTNATSDPNATQKAELAKQLGIKIADYPPEASFPIEYFYTVLRPGSSIDEVHSIVKGYSKVLHCETWSEIYYFFDNRDADALRVQIFYNDKGEYDHLLGEDEDSRTIWTEGCDIGLIDR